MKKKNVKAAIKRLVRLARLCHRDAMKAKSLTARTYEVGNRNGYMHAAWMIKGLALEIPLEKCRTRNLRLRKQEAVFFN